MNTTVEYSFVQPIT